MLSLVEIFTIMLLHWVADFVCQDERWALGKSKNNVDLTNHTTVYSTLMFLGTWPLFYAFANLNVMGAFVVALLYGIICFVVHTATDYVTSRIVARKFANKHYGGPIPNFGAFTIIGIDQWFHYVQLFLTYWLLT